jgi:hypothetical protein
MPSFCMTHKLFYTFGECPKCTKAHVTGQAYASAASILGRWGQLGANPDLIDQDQFGVCGMTSAVYLLLHHKPDLANDLFAATFADVYPGFANHRFTTAQHQQVAIKFSDLSRRYRVMQKTQDAKARRGAAAAHRVMMAAEAHQQPTQADVAKVNQDLRRVNTTCFVDYCVSRALGQVFKQVAEARYKSEKVRFNMEFDPHGNYGNQTHAGTLALRTHNLAFIMKEILGAIHVHIASKAGPAPVVRLAPQVSGVTTSTFANLAQLDQQFQLRLTGVPKSFALAAIYASIVRNGHIQNPSPGNPENPRLAYNHWIVIKSFTQEAPPGDDVGAGVCPNGHSNVGIWTWAKNYTARICQQHVLSYVQDVIFGQF